MTPSFDINDWLRKQQMLGNMPNVAGQQQPSDVAGSVNYQPPADFNKVAGSATYQPGLQDPYQMAAQAQQQVQKGFDTSELTAAQEDVKKTIGSMPDMEKLKQRGEAYSEFRPRPTGYETDPNTGKSMYPRNKLLTAFVAPLMLKEFIMDPKGTKEKLDFVTKKGLGEAEAKWDTQEAQAKRSFETTSAVTNQIMKTLSERLTADNTRVGIQKALFDVNKQIAGLPLEYQEQAARIAASQAAAVKDKAPHWDLSNLQTAYAKGADGKYYPTTVVPKTYPDGRDPEWYELGKENTPLKDFIPGGKVDLATMDEKQRLTLDRINQYVAKNGKYPIGDDMTTITQGVDKDTRKIVEEEQEQASIRAEGRAEARDVRAEGRAEQSQDRRDLIRYRLAYDTDARREDDRINQQISKLGSLNKTLNQAQFDKNDVAKVLAIGETATALTSPGTTLSRYQAHEVGDIRSAPGRMQAAGAALKSWLAGGPPIPPQTLSDIRRLAKAQLDEEEEKQRIRNWAKKEVMKVPKGPGAAQEIQEIQTQRDEKLHELFDPAPQETPEQERQRLQDQLNKNKKPDNRQRLKLGG